MSTVVRSELNLLVGEVIRPLLNDIRSRFEEMKTHQALTAPTANDVVRDIVSKLRTLHGENRFISGSVENEMMHVQRTQQQQQSLQSVDEIMSKNPPKADQLFLAQQARIDSIDTRDIRSQNIRMKVDNSVSDPSPSSSAGQPVEQTPLIHLYPKKPCGANTSFHSPSGIPCEVNHLIFAPPGVPREAPPLSTTLPASSDHREADYNHRFPSSFGQERRRNESSDSQFGFPMMPAKLIPPPEFSAVRYAAWKKEVGYWRELYSYVPEGQVMCTLGLTATSELKRILMRFVKKTRNEPQSRTLKNLMLVLDENYAVSSRDREMDEMGKLSQLYKEPNEPYQLFWHRYETIMDALESPRGSLGEEFLFTRCLKGLNLTPPQRINILMALDCRGLNHTVSNLKNCSLKILGMYRSLNQPDKHVLYTDQLESQDDDDGYEDVYIAAKRKTTRNRPGMEKMAIKKTQGSMNLDNETFMEYKTDDETFLGKGNSPALICFRCGGADHLLRQCPLPYTATLAFAPRKGTGKPQPTDGPKGKGKGKTFLIAEDDVPAVTDRPAPEFDAHQLYPAHTETHPITTQAPEDKTNAKVGEDWVNSWFDDSTVYTASTCEEEYCINISLPNTSTVVSSKDPSYLQCCPLIDSGASKTVVGESWIRMWMKLKKDQPTPFLTTSSGTFRFGSQQKFPSMGQIIPMGRIQGEDTKGAKIQEILAIETDVISLPIPFLLSHDTLQKMNANINFRSTTLSINDYIIIPLRFSSGGHVTFTWIFEQNHPQTVQHQSFLKDMFIIDDTEHPPLNSMELRKLHIQFGHADYATMRRMIQQAGRKAEDSEMRATVRSCLCNRSSGPGERPIVSRYQSTAPGQVVFADTFSPVVSQPSKHPSVILVDSFSRFLCAKFLQNIRPSSYISILTNHWSVLFGYPPHFGVRQCDDVLRRCLEFIMQRFRYQCCTCSNESLISTRFSGASCLANQVCVPSYFAE